MHVRAAVAVACLVVAAAQAHAQSAPNNGEKDMVGAWELSNAARDKLCTATFSVDRASGGFKVDLEPKCAEQFPPMKDVAAWKFPDNDLLRLLDARGRSIAEFSEVEAGIFEAPTTGLGVLFLQQPGNLGPPPKPAEDVAGDWIIMRGGRALCTLTLATTVLNEGMTLSAKPGCDNVIVQQGFSQWRVDRDELMLTPARGNPWRFEQVDDKTWQRVPEVQNPYTLVRP